MQVRQQVSSESTAVLPVILDFLKIFFSSLPLYIYLWICLTIVYFLILIHNYFPSPQSLWFIFFPSIWHVISLYCTSHSIPLHILTLSGPSCLKMSKDLWGSRKFLQCEADYIWYPGRSSRHCCRFGVANGRRSVYRISRSFCDITLPEFLITEDTALKWVNSWKLEKYFIILRHDSQ